MAKGVYVGVNNFEKVTLPEGYTQVEFIQSSGTQYVDTAVLPDNDIGIQMDVEIATFAKGCVFAGSRVSGDTRFWFGAEGSATSPTFYYGWNTATETSISVKGRKKINFNFLNDRKVNVDTELAGTISTAYTSNPNSIYIFCGNQGGEATYFFPLKLYGMKITKGDSVIRNYIPCTNASGVAGLYDLVNGKFYGNAGTGQFFAPVPVKLPSGYKQVDWIQSSGTQYINTGVNAQSGVEVTLDVEFLNVTGSLGVIGAVSNSVRIFPIHLSTTFGYGYNTFNAINGATVSANTRYNIYSKLYAGEQKIVVNGETILSASDSGSYNLAINMYLFALNSGGSVFAPSTTKFYGGQIKLNGVLVRNYIPCTNASGVAGLYDLVGFEFYPNNGTGTFAVGEEISAEPKSVARKVKQMYVGVSDKARRVKKAYIGIGGVARPFWGDKKLEYYGTITNLSQGRLGLSATSVGDYAIFAGGEGASVSTYYKVVDAYDKNLTKSTPTTLTIQREGIGATTVGDYAVFAGGNANPTTYNTVEAYNKSLTMTQPTALQHNRTDISATTIGNYALFVGGDTGTTQGSSKHVDAYNTSLTRSTPTQLNENRGRHGGTTVGDYAVFAGGAYYGTSWTMSKTVETYNKSLTRSTSSSTLSLARYFVTGARVGNYALFISGTTTSGTDRTSFQKAVDVFDASITRVAVLELSDATRYGLSATTIGKHVLIAGKEYFDGGSGVVESFDDSLTRTVQQSLPRNTVHLAMTTLGDYALIGGGEYGSSASGAPVSPYVYAYKLV